MAHYLDKLSPSPSREEDLSRLVLLDNALSKNDVQQHAGSLARWPLKVFSALQWFEIMVHAHRAHSHLAAVPLSQVNLSFCS